MKKFAQTAVLVAGLTGLAACASTDVSEPYGERTAGGVGQATYTAPATGNSDALQVCLERENRLLAMNKACYRK